MYIFSLILMNLEKIFQPVCLKLMKFNFLNSRLDLDLYYHCPIITLQNTISSTLKNKEIFGLSILFSESFHFVKN